MPPCPKEQKSCDQLIMGKNPLRIPRLSYHVGRRLHVARGDTIVDDRVVALPLLAFLLNRAAPLPGFGFGCAWMERSGACDSQSREHLQYAHSLTQSLCLQPFKRGSLVRRRRRRPLQLDLAILPPSSVRVSRSAVFGRRRRRRFRRCTVRPSVSSSLPRRRPPGNPSNQIICRCCHAAGFSMFLACMGGERGRCLPSILHIMHSKNGASCLLTKKNVAQRLCRRRGRRTNVAPFQRWRFSALSSRHVGGSLEACT